MIHIYVARWGAESHGNGSVCKGRAGVLVQLTAGIDQTRIAISPDDALRLADQLMELALKAMNGLSGQRGDRRSEWYLELGCETDVGLVDEVDLKLHDDGGTNGDNRYSRLAERRDGKEGVGTRRR